jgi:Asp-tRNA(Asn)/Glu-tRNA(Gln) amidotransferase A subunit family amidase
MNSWSVAEMLAGLRSGRAISRQLVEIAVDRARQCATDLNAFAAISDKATASAAASDRKYREGTARKLGGSRCARHEDLEKPRTDIRHALMAYTAPFNLTGHPVADVPMRRRDGVLPAGLQIVGHRGHDNEVIEAAIEIEMRNAEYNNLKEDKDETDGTKNKPDPV